MRTSMGHDHWARNRRLDPPIEFGEPVRPPLPVTIAGLLHGPVDAT